MLAAPVLSVRRLSKLYGPIKALNNVDFDLRRGEIHALAGANGAGKSTLMKIIGGIVQPDEGEILIDGKAVAFSSPARAQSLGIGLVHQEIALCPDASVAENILMAATARNTHWFMDYHDIRRKARAAVERLAPLPVDVKVCSLPISQQQLVEIAKALTLDCRILILDEPTAALTERETEALFTIVRGLRDRGISIIYISHRMAEIFSLCDRITVLRDGSQVGTEDVASTTPTRVVARMVGHELGMLFPAKMTGPSGPAVLEVRGLSGDRFTDVSFTVRRGEILGIAGLIGAGRSEIVKAVCGLCPRSAGTFSLFGAALPSPNLPRRGRARRRVPIGEQEHRGSSSWIFPSPPTSRLWTLIVSPPRWGCLTGGRKMQSPPSSVVAWVSRWGTCPTRFPLSAAATGRRWRSRRCCRSHRS